MALVFTKGRRDVTTVQNQNKVSSAYIISQLYLGRVLSNQILCQIHVRWTLNSRKMVLGETYPAHSWLYYNTSLSEMHIYDQSMTKHAIDDRKTHNSYNVHEVVHVNVRRIKIITMWFKKTTLHHYTRFNTFCFDKEWASQSSRDFGWALTDHFEKLSPPLS